MNSMRKMFVDYIAFEREFSDVYRRLCESANENDREEVAKAFDEMVNLMIVAKQIRDPDISAKARYISRILNCFISGEGALEITKGDLEGFQKMLADNANIERNNRAKRQVRELQALNDVMPIIAKQNRAGMRYECWLLARRCGISKEWMEDKFGYKRYTSFQYLLAVCDYVDKSTDDDLAADIDIWLEGIAANYTWIKNTKFAEMVKKH